MNPKAHRTSLNNDQSSKNLSQKEQQNLINELAFPSIPSNENFDNCKKSSEQDERGWENLFHQTQLEIQELEMRANAIKAMIEKKSSRRLSDQSINDDSTKDKNEQEGKISKGSVNNNELLDDIESEDGDYISEEDEEHSTSKERISREKSEEEKQIKREIEAEYLDIQVKLDHKRIKKAEKPKRDLSRLSVESGEIFEDEDSCDEIYEVQTKKSKAEYHDQQYKRAKSPVSITSSIDSFGRNRRKRSRSYNDKNRERSNSSSFGSLDEILREADLEEAKKYDSNKSKSHSHTHKHRHHKN